MSPPSPSKRGGRRRSSVFGGVRRKSADDQTRWVERHNVRKKGGLEVELYDMDGLTKL